MASEATHPLKAFLQLQLASDSSAVLHLPYVLSVLTPDVLSPSPHLQKWTARVNSLIHSQESGARWAGLCLASRTSMLSKPLMLEYAQSWIGAALPMLSNNEPLPNLKAAIRLLRYIFSAATDTTEFQRQLVTPNVPKYSQAVIILTEKHDDPELKIIALSTLAMLVPLHPTLHKALHASLSSLVLRFLNGSAPTPLSNDLIQTAARLYAVLHYTGGKVGASGQWRKSLDDTLTFTWDAFHTLRSALSTDDRHGNAPSTASDPSVNVSLNADRLKCGVTVLCEILKSTAPRSVQLPINSVLQLIIAMLSCTPDEQTSGPVDQSLRAIESTAIPIIWSLGCDLLISFTKCARHHLTPHVSRLLTITTYQLEQQSTFSSRLTFLRVIPALISHTHLSHDGVIVNRTARVVLPSLTAVLLERSDAQADTGAGRRNKKGKRRVRGYEGDELFKVTREVICPSAVEGKVVLAALDAIQVLLRNPHLSPAIQSLSVRILLSMLLSLPQIPKSLLSPDATLHGKVLARTQELCIEVGIGTTSTASKSLGLVVRGLTVDGSDQILTSLSQRQHVVDLLIHPRQPPLLRPLPHVESLALFRGEEGEEEVRLRESLHLVHGDTTELSELPASKSTVDYEAPGQSLRTVVPEPIPPKTTYVDRNAVREVEMQRAAPDVPLKSTPNGTNVLPDLQPLSTSTVTPTVSVSTASAEGTSTSFPPPSEPLVPTAGPSKIPTRLSAPEREPVPVTLRIDEDEDEEMPTINMDSDSEIE